MRCILVIPETNIHKVSLGPRLRTTVQDHRMAGVWRPFVLPSFFSSFFPSFPLCLKPGMLTLSQAHACPYISSLRLITITGLFVFLCVVSHVKIYSMEGFHTLVYKQRVWGQVWGVLLNVQWSIWMWHVTALLGKWRVWKSKGLFDENPHMASCVPRV